MNTNNALARVVALATSMLVLTAATNLILGTSARDILIGTPGDDKINGLAGADWLYGHAGNDIYIVDTTDDRVFEEPDEGTDTIRAGGSSRFGFLPRNVENLVLTGSANISGLGNGLNNRITGNGGSNGICGSGGNDTLRGGGGTDQFCFWYAYIRPDVDRLPDFNDADERVALVSYWPGIDSGYVSGPGGSPNPLPSTQFHVGPYATTAWHRILYDPATGKLRHDADGTGPLGPYVFAILPTGLALTAGHILVYPINDTDI